MDRVEYGIKLEQMTKLKEKGDYESAAKIADGLDWRKVKKWSDMSLAEEVYEKAGRPSDARNICVYAYNRNLGGKRLVYRLAELSIMINDLDEADDLYREFVETAPNDMERYVLLYKLNSARGVPVERLIEILEEYKKNELDEQYEYELATLYLRAGRLDACIKECDDLILWFNEGEYVEKALRLKSQHAELTPAQAAKLREIEEYKTRPREYESVISESSAREKYSYEQHEEEEIKVVEKDYSIYDTQNIQAELAKSMADILASMKNSDDETAVTDMNSFEAKAAEQPEDTVTESPKQDEQYDDESAAAAEPAVQAITDFDSEESEPIQDGEDLDGEDIPAEAVDEVSEGTGILNEPEELLHTSNADDVDEPTKEIRINTHHWKRYVSTMEEETAPGLTPSQEIVDNTPADVTGEDDVLPDAKPEQPEETAAHAEEATKEPVVQPEEPVAQAEETPVLHDTSKEEAEAEPDIIEGQMDIMGWLMNMEEDKEAESESEEVREKAEESVFEEITEEAGKPESEEVTEEAEMSESEEVPEESGESEETAQEKIAPKQAPSESGPLMDTTDIVVSEITRQLIAEAESDYMEKQSPTHIIDEEYADEEEYEEILNEDEKKYLGKYLFISGLEANAARIIHAKKHETKDGTSSFGNIVVMGKSRTDKTGFAINLFRAMYAGEDMSSHKIAKTNAANINRNGIAQSADKVRGATLIIENAGLLTKNAIAELVEFMLGDTDSMAVILTGESFAINRIFAENPKFSAMFDYSIEIRQYSVNELVALAKEYARIKGYAISDKAILQLFLLIGEIQNSGSESEMEQVKALVDKAIAHCRKKSKNPGGSGRNLVPLKPKDFEK